MQVDLSTYRKEEDFAEFFDEGEVVPIWDFLSSKGIDPTKIGSEAKQRKFVEEDSRDMIACFYMFLFVALKLVANHPIVKKEKTHLTLTPHHSLPCKPLNPTTHAMRTASMKDPESGSKISFFLMFLLLIQELGLSVLTDKGKLVVTILDGKRKVRLGNRQAAGKQKVSRQYEVVSLIYRNWTQFMLERNIYKITKKYGEHIGNNNKPTLKIDNKFQGTS